jgi:biotin carboxyl carrier protein
MKYTVRIANTSYEVEIDDIHARPVIARVEGQQFEITPEDEVQPAPSVNGVEALEPDKKETPGRSSRSLPMSPAIMDGNEKELTAPLPGTVISIFVKPGEQIETGQVVLIIEAMKMKNSIRSTRAGTIAEVLVNVGQAVAHKQALVRFG